ncbi:MULTISPECIES: hypothetical protein [unclassified Streptomyces]|uniref:hypothetical protein n=1 Tax=unclassified Streptomyces TaxID=2593676 RepID=UPI0033BA0825
MVAAPAHLVAKLEKEQAAQSSRHPPRFTSGGPVTGGAADLEAAGELLREAFPLLPGDGDGDGEMDVPAAAVAEQRRAAPAMPRGACAWSARRSDSTGSQTR